VSLICWLLGHRPGARIYEEPNEVQLALAHRLGATQVLKRVKAVCLRCGKIVNA
jgi:hypothetical protein